MSKSTLFNSRSIRSSALLLLALVAVVLLGALASSGLAQSTAPARGVYRIDPDPATTFPGDPAEATAYVEDKGFISCLQGTVPREPRGGFDLNFNPQQSPARVDTWSAAVTLIVSNQVPPRSYQFSIWAQEQDGNCTGPKIGPTYTWEVTVVAAPTTTLPPPTTVAPKANTGPSTTRPTATTTTVVPTSTTIPGPLPPLALPTDLDPVVPVRPDTPDKPLRRSDRSLFVLAVSDPTEVSRDPQTVATSAALALLLTLLIAGPAAVFNATFKENHQELIGWFAFARPAVARTRKIFRKVSRSWWGLGLMTLVMGGLYGLLSPDFGVNRKSLVLFLGLVASILLLTVIGEAIAGLYIFRRLQTRVYLRVFPAALIIAIASVAISRLVDFQPGYLYGLVAGAAYRGSLPKEREGAGIAFASGLLFVMSLAAWLAWLPVKGLAEQPDASFGILVLEALLVATFVAGIEGLLFGLMPLRFLDGDKLAAWNKFVWAVIFFAAAFAFIHVLLDPATGFIGFSEEIPAITVLALFAGFGLFSMAFWGYFRFRPSRGRDVSKA